MKADGRLIENVENAHKARANLGCKPDSLALAAGERPRRARKRQIGKPDRLQEAKARANFPQNLLGDDGHGARELQALHKVQRLTDRESTEVHDAQAADRHGKADIGQAVPVALRARTLGHALLEFFSHRVGLRFGESARDVVENALKGPLERAASVCALIIDREIFLARAVQNGVQRVLGKVLHGRCERELIFFCKRLKIHPGDRVVLDVIEAAGLDRAVQDRLVPVGDDKVGVCHQLRPETRADRARAVGIVKGKHARRELRKTDAAVLAGVVLGEDRVAVVCHFVQNHKAARKRQRGFDRVGESAR